MKSFKIFGAVLALTLTLLSVLPQHAVADGGFGFGKDKFVKQFYFAHAKTGNGKGYNSANAHLIATDTTFWAIPAATIIEKVYAIVDTAITGTTVLTVGDTDGATSFVPAAAFTLGTPGMYGWDVKSAGAYLRIQTAGATDAGDIYVVPNAKYYAAAGKFLTVTNTTANTAGAFRIVVEGYNSVL